MKYGEKEEERVDGWKKCHIIKVNDLLTEILDELLEGLSHDRFSSRDSRNNIDFNNYKPLFVRVMCKSF